MDEIINMEINMEPTPLLRFYIEAIDPWTEAAVERLLDEGVARWNPTTGEIVTTTGAVIGHVERVEEISGAEALALMG